RPGRFGPRAVTRAVLRPAMAPFLAFVTVGLHSDGLPARHTNQAAIPDVPSTRRHDRAAVLHRTDKLASRVDAETERRLHARGRTSSKSLSVIGSGLACRWIAGSG